MEDVTKYFTVNLTNISGASKDVYIGIKLSCNFATQGNAFSFSTKPTVMPSHGLTLSNGQNVSLTMADYNSLLSNVQYDMQGISWQDVLLLPEGNYELCVTAYQWSSGGVNPSPVELGKGCLNFTICYSGSAPEFVTPVVGQSASNLNIPNPLDITDAGIQQGSDNRTSSQYASIPLQQKLTFRWTGVVSNCLTSNMFRYVLKIVEINPYQNALSAIRENATLATIDNGSSLFYTHDTINNKQFRLIPGHAYAAQVEAVAKAQYTGSIINLGNEGKSQVIAFVWGNEVNGVVTNQEGSTHTATTSSVKDNKEDVLKTFRNQYVAVPFRDQTTYDALVARFSAEKDHAPATEELKELDVDGQKVYVITDTSRLFTAKWMPLRSDSINSLVYNVYLYKYIGGDVSNSLAFQPICGLQYNVTDPHAFAASNFNPVSLEYPGWESNLELGERYVFMVDASAIYRYAKTTTYTTTEYINGIPSYKDSSVVNICLDAENFSSYTVFQWGVDKNTLTKVSPAEFTYPTYTTDGGDSWDQIPEVQKDEDFEFRWDAASGVSIKDSVNYDFFLCKLKKGMTPKKAAGVDTLVYKPNLASSTTSLIDDEIRDSLKIGESYVAYLKTRILTNASDYNISNDGVSKYAVFKLITIDSTEVRLNKTIECNPGHAKGLDQTAIMPPTDSLIKNKVRLQLGEMPLVIQKIKSKDEKKKTITGEGYVVWKPFSYGDVCIKVQFDSLKVNSKYEVISGTAKSISQDNTNYVQMDFGFGWTDWTDEKIDKLATKYGQKDYVKNYYNEVNKYANYVNGFRGVFEGGDVGLGVFTLPMRLDDGVFGGSKNVKMTIGEMYFTPNTALMNMTAIFNSNSDNMYVPFVATNICMSPTSILGNIDDGIDLYLARNYEVDMSDGYKMRFKAADTLGKPDNGCYISFDTSGFKLLAADIQIDFDPEDLYKADLKNNGTVLKGKPVQARFYTKIADWDDWTTTITMDAFAFPGAEDYTFIPTGRGIVLDHSKTQTPKEVKLPASYVSAPKKDASGNNNASGSGGKTQIGGTGTGSGSGSGAGAPGAGQNGGAGSNSSKGGKGGDKPKPTPAPASWQGFYMQNLTVLFPDNVSNTFVDINGKTDAYKDSMMVYRYGLNDTQVDSTYYYYPGSRITAGLQDLVIDSAGISLTGYVSNIIRAETDKGGGWALSLDTIAIQFEKSEFKQGRFVGQVGMPLFKGKLEYGLMLGSKELKFNLQPKDTNFKLDLWLANIGLDKKSSHFTITSNDTIEKTLIDLTLNGTINIDFKKIGLPVEFAAVKFENMYLRNYNKTDSADYKFDGLDFDAGRWSKASPQKYLAVNSDPMFKGSVGGFSFNVYTLSPIFENISGKKYKAGIQVSGDIGISVGSCSNGGISAGTGFKVWGEVNLDGFDVGNVSGELDSVWLKCDLDMFKLEGRLDFFNEDDVLGDGLRGSVKVEILKKVSFGVGAGFGTVKRKDKPDETFDWWYIEGVAKCNPGIPLGAVNLTGLGGGFAYNMEPKQTGQNTDPRSLRKAGQNTSFEGAMVSSGMEFIPKYDAWVAKAGVALALEDENTMNADGRISLRVAEGHFTGFMMQVNASVITHYDKQADSNSNATINVGALIDVEDTKEKFMFNFSACVESKINLTSLLKDAAAAAVPLDIDYPDVGELMNSTTGDFLKSTNADLAKADAENKKKNQNQQSSGENSGETPKTEDSNSNSSVGGSASIKIPIDLSVTHFYNTVSAHTGTADEWCFSIGRPPYDERVTFAMDANLVVCKAEAKFTFYFAIGNYFPGGFTLPDIPSDVAEFLGKDYDKAKKKRITSMPDAGGFAMGASFNAKVEFDMFLYVDINAWIGFDVALMNVHGQGCEGYDNIGKNNFYALGQAYAMLEGSVGLSLNLGFWKGRLELLSMGVGALLQGGGPRPTWCYGLLRFKASCLGGLIKINTSVDFDLGDVCVPNAGDPLANVKLLESITPSQPDVKSSNQAENMVSPFADGMITSNMPWDEDILLCDNKDENGNPIDMRKFRFVLWEPYMTFGTADNGIEKPSFKSVSYDQLNFVKSRSNGNLYFFDTKEGGFYESTTHQIKLVARAFEYRKACPSCKVTDTTKYRKVDYDPTDLPYDLNTKTRMKASLVNSDMDYWYNPTFFVANDKSRETHPFIQDTVVYISTTAAPDNLTDQVLFTWPYNGDPFVPVNEISGYVYIYMKKDREKLFNPQKLAAENKILKAFLVERNGLEEKTGIEIQEYDIQYFPRQSGQSYLKIKLPREYQKADPTIFQVKLYIMNKDQYNSQYNQQVMQAQQQVVSVTQEVQGRDLLNIMSDVVGQTNTTTTTTTTSVYGSSSSGTVGSSSNGHSIGTLATGSSSSSGTRVPGVLAHSTGSNTSSSSTTKPSRIPRGTAVAASTSSSSSSSSASTSSSSSSSSSSAGFARAGATRVTASASRKTTKSAQAGGGNKTSTSQELAQARPVTLMLNTNVEQNGALINSNILQVSAQQTSLKSMAVGNNNSSVMSSKSMTAGNAQLGKTAMNVHASAQFNGNLVRPGAGLGSGKTPTLPGNGNLIGGGTTPTIPGAGGGRLGGGTGTPTFTGNGQGVGGTLTNPSGGTTINPGQTGGSFGSGGFGSLPGAGRFGSGFGGNYNFNSGNIEDIIVEVSVSNSYHNSLHDIGRNGVLGVRPLGDGSSSESESQTIDIRQTQINEAKQEYREEGADTMMNYSRTKINSFAICQQIGNVVYTLYFRTAGSQYKTYADIANAIKTGVASNSKMSGKLTHATQGKDVTTTLPAVNDQSQARVLYTFAYLFKSYKPEDPLLYRKDITLPPIFNLCVNVKKTETQNKAFALHAKYKTQLDSYYDFILFHRYVPKKYPEQKNDYKGDFDGWGSFVSVDNTVPGSVWQWNRYDGSTFANEDYRIVENTGHNVETGLGYFNSDWWSTPAILDISITEKTPCRIDSSYFNDLAKSFPTKGDNPTVTIIDKVSAPVYSDLSMYNGLFQKMFGYATALDGRGYHGSSKKDGQLKEDLSNPTGAYLTFDDFPVRFPRLYRTMAYFNAFNLLFEAHSNKDPNKFVNFKGNTWYDISNANSSMNIWSKTEHLDWYKDWIFSDVVYSSYGSQGLERIVNSSDYRKKLQEQPFFKGLDDKTVKANDAQYVYLNIYCISPLNNEYRKTGSYGVEGYLALLAQDAQQAHGSVRLFRTTRIFDLDWKFNLNDMSKDQADKLKKYNSIKVYTDKGDLYTE